MIQQNNIGQQLVSAPSGSISAGLPLSGFHSQNAQPLNKTNFKKMINIILGNLRNSSKHKINNFFLFGEVSNHLEDDNSLLFKGLFKIINKFYGFYPFDTTNIVSNAFKIFLNKWTLVNALNDKKIGGPLTVLLAGNPDWKKTFFEKYLLAELLKHVNSKTIGEIGTTYISYEATLRKELLDRLEKRLKKIDTSFAWTKYPNLHGFLTSFSYNDLASANSESVYTNHFTPKNPNFLSVDETVYQTTILKKFLDDKLLPSSKSELNQKILVHLFRDLLIILQQKKRGSGTLKTANQLINNKNNPSLWLTSLEYFIPGISKMLQKYGIYLKQPGSNSGFVFKQDSNFPFLLPTSISGTQELRFALVFETSYNETSSNANTVFRNIKITKFLTSFEKVKEEVEKKTASMPWSSGYNNFHTWTEYDLWSWISTVTTVNDLMQLFAKNGELILTTSDFGKFSSFDLKTIDLKQFETNNHLFRIKIVLKFLKSSKSKFGSVTVHFRLMQIDKKNRNSRPIESELIQLGDSFPVYSMIEYMASVIKTKFADELNFDKFEKNDKFWLNEFLDINNIPTKKLKTQKEIKQRTNADDIIKFIDQIINDLNANYRNNFWLDEEYSMKEKKATNLSNGKVLYILTALINIRDTITNAKYRTQKEKVLGDMSLFSKVPTGPFKDRGSILDYFKLRLKELKPVVDTNQKPVSVGDQLNPSFQFSNINDEKVKVSLKNILDELKQMGFEKISFSKVQQAKFQGTLAFKANGTPNYYDAIIISFEVHYHDFSDGKDKVETFTLTLKVSLNVKTPKEIEEGYRDIFDKLTDLQKTSQNLKDLINKEFQELVKGKKQPPSFEDSPLDRIKQWRDDVDVIQYEEVIRKVLKIISGYKIGEKLLEKLKDLYNNNIPESVLSKLSNPDHIDTILRILDLRGDISDSSLKKVIENEEFLNALAKVPSPGLKDAILELLKIVEKTKYAYFAGGIGMGGGALLASGAVFRRIKLRKKIRKIDTQFKPNKIVGIISVISAVVATATSIILLLLFFINKGGF